MLWVSTLCFPVKQSLLRDSAILTTPDLHFCLPLDSQVWLVDTHSAGLSVLLTFPSLPLSVDGTVPALVLRLGSSDQP